jgi:hypothetical protein
MYHYRFAILLSGLLEREKTMKNYKISLKRPEGQKLPNPRDGKHAKELFLKLCKRQKLTPMIMGIVDEYFVYSIKEVPSFMARFLVVS